ncbi:hypothetical protein SGPA1_40557 [Streptomyces misionensis JCM 4497]
MSGGAASLRRTRGGPGHPLDRGRPPSSDHPHDAQTGSDHDPHQHAPQPRLALPGQDPGFVRLGALGRQVAARAGPRALRELPGPDPPPGAARPARADPGAAGDPGGPHRPPDGAGRTPGARAARVGHRAHDQAVRGRGAAAPAHRPQRPRGHRGPGAPRRPPCLRHEDGRPAAAVRHTGDRRGPNVRCSSRDERVRSPDGRPRHRRRQCRAGQGRGPAACGAGAAA